MGARWSTTTKRVVVGMLTLAAIFVIYRAGDIVRPFVWAAIVAYVLLPVVAIAERRLSLPRTVAALIVFVALLATVIGGGRILVPLAIEQLRDLQRTLPTLVVNAENTLTETADQLGLEDLDQLIVGFAGVTDLTAMIGRNAVAFVVGFGHFLLAFLTGVLEVIPIVGPITAGAIACLVALGHPAPFGLSQIWYVVVVAVMYTVLRHAEDYFVIPLVIGRIVKLHPAVVIFSLLTGGALFGLLGVLLAVPVAATARLVLIYAGAKLRDEDPFPQLEEELAVPHTPSAETAPAHPVGRRAHP